MRTSITECLGWDMPDGVLGTEDAYYISPTQSDIDEMLAFVAARKEQIPYTEEAFDCDNYSREAKHWMDVWALRHFRNSRSALSAGMAYIRISTEDGFILGYHAMNVIRRNDGQWFFYEPQNGKLFPVEGPLTDGTITVLKIEL